MLDKVAENMERTLFCSVSIKIFIDLALVNKLLLLLLLFHWIYL